LILTIIASALLGGVIGWFTRGWWLFRGTSLASPPTAAYEVRLTRNSSHGVFSKTIYADDDLAAAKRVYYSAKGPARTTVELYTRGNHTASRRA
jgi:hypothetical protein